MGFAPGQLEGGGERKIPLLCRESVKTRVRTTGRETRAKSRRQEQKTRHRLFAMTSHTHGPPAPQGNCRTQHKCQVPHAPLYTYHFI